MTPKETEKYKKYIADVKRALAAEKRKFGAYHDGRGMRYYPPKAYIKLQDYKGGLTYLKWFYKNFPDDIGFPDFLFEWTFILFKTDNLKEAERKAFQTFCANTYLFDKFLNLPIVPIEKYEYSNMDIPEFTDTFEYSSNRSEFSDLGQWLAKYLASKKFIQLKIKFIDLKIRIKAEKDPETRSDLIRKAWQIEAEA